ncbi:CocE/NonD family hydrolase [Jiella mangrovi]|uniref:CocE/NonD family hydrolase n=1 Tax=Jiella mangrovi TaxID=2821407 RepID=A0ABS4BGM5_9HYPH|nr:CocE/NonD family hydrolase [Jiella mangrovi]MBP0615903.1 CocE/NonD family hydrolase [Jiella mangrovi]
MENTHSGQSPAPFRQIVIPLSDGTRLTARLWLPELQPGRTAPVVMEWIPYRQSDLTAIWDSMMHGYFAENGIAAIRVDLRGSGNSEGLLRDEYLRQEQDDALEVIAWLAGQDWCNGNVGMIGISWGGFAGLQIAARRPPALKAIVTCCSTDDRYSDDVHFMGGGLLIDGIQWGAGLFSQLGRPADPAHVGDRWREIWQNRLDHLEPPLAGWLAHMERDEFWKHGSICENYADIECAVYAATGWTDGYSDPVLRLMENLSCPRKGLIGPWTHIYPNWGIPGPKIGFLDECLRWWKHWLCGEDTGIMDEPRLRLWMGEDLVPHPRRPEIGGGFVAVSGWPAEGEPAVFHVADGRLTSAAAAETDPIRIDTPQTLGALGGEWCPLDGGGDGPEFQSDGRMDDALSVCFDTERLARPLEAFGIPRLRLDLAMDGDKATVIVRLNEIHESGRSARVTFAIRRITRPEGIAAGERFSAEIPLKGVAYRFGEGRRMRVAISTSYWPMVWPELKAGAVTLYPDATSLLLPSRPDDAVEENAPFGPPVSAAPIASETIEAGAIRRTVTIEAETGRTTVEQKGGPKLWRQEGLTLGDVTNHGYTILPDDPTSARAYFESIQRFERPGWAVRLEALTEVSVIEGRLHLKSSYDAFENDKPVFSKTWHHEFDY